MRKLILFSILFLNLFFLKGQTITLKKDSVSFNEIISIIEEQTKVHFYYANEWVNDKNFNVNFNESNLKEVISWLGNKTDLNHKILNDKNIVFTKNYRIKTNFSEEYSRFLSHFKKHTRDTIKYDAPKISTIEKKSISNEYKVFTIGSRAKNPKKEKVTLSGKIRDIETGESLIGTVIYIELLKDGTATNQYGLYAFSLPVGSYKVEYRSVGMKTTYRNIIILSDGKLNVEIKSKPTSLKEVVITAKSEDAVRNLRMGIEKISIKTLKQLPLGMGEADIIKSTLLLPGVQSVGEASNGFNVRGGNTDQNLILLNEAPIVNTSHFFGFFSGFNTDIVKDITLYKSGIPANYGGRASSVMDLKLKDGNKKRYSLNGGISPVSGRLTFEGPINKGQGSFIIAGRTTYSDWVLKLLKDQKLKNSKANFHDLQGNLDYELNDKNSLYLSSYYSHDKFDHYQDDAFQYNTFATTLKWKHIFSPKLFSTISGVVSNYNYTNESRNEPSQSNKVKYRLNQYLFKSDFSYNSSLNHKIGFGFHSTLYDLSPGNRSPLNNESLISSKTLEGEKALEMAVYIGDKFELTHFMSLSVGLRYSFYGNLGPKTQFNYLGGHPRNEFSIENTEKKSGFINTYSGPELRISSNINLSTNSSIKIGYNRMNQYIQMISNTAAMTPTDIWKLSDKYLKPQRCDQYSIGFYKNISENRYEASVETYYKNLKNIIDYKGGAQLVMNEHLETDVLNGKGKAYGIELMLQKKKGKLTGWVNYTFSKILHKIDSELGEERVNNGDYFPANYDKPHDFKFVANYKISRRMNISTNLSYSTGRPFTPPLAYYNFSGSDRVYYSDRNSMRMPDYCRLDIAATINGNLVAKKLNHSSWTFAIYNVLGRQNAYNVFFRTEGEKVQGYKMSIFGKPIFTVTYNFKLFGNAKDDF